MSGEGPADPSEMGRELRASELKAGMIVFIEPPIPEDQPRLAFTMWVVAVLPDSDLVVFFSGVEKRHVGNFITPEDGLVDGKGREVRVFEYLGEP